MLSCALVLGPAAIARADVPREERGCKCTIPGVGQDSALAGGMLVSGVALLLVARRRRSGP
jgi:hypothetical protein